MECECMDGTDDFIGQCGIDQPVTRHKHFAIECVRHDRYLEMGLRSRWYIVPVALIDHFQKLWLQ